MLTVIAWRGLDRVAQGSQHVLTSSDRSQRLSQVMSQLEIDLMEAGQLRQSGRFALRLSDSVSSDALQSSFVEFQRVLGGQDQSQRLPNGPLLATTLQWIRWEVHHGVIIRSLPERGQSQQMLVGVSAMQLRPLGVALTQEKLTQPERWSGLEVVFLMNNGQKVRRVLSMRD